MRLLVPLTTPVVRLTQGEALVKEYLGELEKDGLFEEAVEEADLKCEHRGTREGGGGRAECRYQSPLPQAKSHE